MKHLRLPERPQRPLNAFFKFMKEVQNSVIAEHPKQSLANVNKVIAEMWHSLDKTKKETYYKEFHDEMVKHRTKMAEYNNSLSEDDRNKIKERIIEVEKEIAKKKMFKYKRMMWHELQKPVLENPFFKYMYECEDRQPDEKNIAYVKRKSAEWSKLSHIEKEKFKPTAEQLENHK